MNEQKTATLEGVEPIKYTVNVDHHEAAQAAERMFWATQFLSRAVSAHAHDDAFLGNEQSEIDLGISAILDYLHDDCGKVVAFLCD